jgi:hypothetical protein
VHFRLKLAKDFAKPFLMCAILMDSLLIFLNGGGDNNQDVDGPFHHFGYFYMNSFDESIVLVVRHTLVHIAFSVNDIISHWLSAALASEMTKLCTCHSWEWVR